MSYDSHFVGQITITPPLNWAEIRSARQPGLQDVRLVLDETVTDTDSGQTSTIHGIAIAPLDIYYYAGIHIEAEVQAVIDAHPSHDFAGSIEACPGDPHGTPWRYTVQGRRVVRQQPQIVWPDDPEILDRACREARRMLGGLMPGDLGNKLADEVATNIVNAVLLPAVSTAAS